MHNSKLFAGGLVVALATWLATLAATTRSICLDEVVADYLEDEAGGRVLAEITAKLTDQALLLRISALGPRIDPIPGYRGVAGSNHITARELESLVSENELRVVTRQDGHQLAGSYAPGRCARIPERRFENGHVVLDAKTERKKLVELRARAPLFDTGRQSIYLVVGASPRLRVDVELGADGTGEITDIESLSEHAVRSRQ